jgi:hypothetical protein
VMEIGYSAVSHANPMIQLSDLIAFTMKKKRAMSQAGYGSKWPGPAHTFFKQCHDAVWPRVEFKMLHFLQAQCPRRLHGLSQGSAEAQVARDDLDPTHVSGALSPIPSGAGRPPPPRIDRRPPARIRPFRSR